MAKGDRNISAAAGHQNFLILGDGDFSWSLDLARHLQSKNIQATLIATGIDSAEELSRKYRDWDSILRRLKGLCSGNLSVEVLHGVNAIANHTRIKKSSVVIFNHPHLGCEDAALHHLFLCHLFHSVSFVWMEKQGSFILTLAQGQYERWECEKAAKRLGMRLECCYAFIPNPSGLVSTYEHRRHQSGKSFKSRSSGSTAYRFVSVADKDCDSFCLDFFPWFQPESKQGIVEPDLKAFVCDLCDKTFREERSFKSHLASKHSSEQQKRQEGRQFTCQQCNSRRFESASALQDHVRSKHTGLHTFVRPDWAGKQTTNPESHPVIGHCDICGCPFLTIEARDNHLLSFVPTKQTPCYLCRFCSRRFREKRAQLQHENFCQHPQNETLSV